MLRRLLSVTGLAVAVLLVGMLPAAAVGSFGPAVAVLAGCPGNGGDAAIGADGTVHGFAECNHQFLPIAYFQHNPNGSHRAELSPYSGVVLAVAWDGVDSTYVVYEQNSQLKIGKRHNGQYLPSTTLSTTGAGVVPYTAGVVASNNQWWVVWSEQVGPGGEFAHTQLFQRHTLLGTAGKTQITATGANVEDRQPSLSFYARRVSLVWTRLTSPQLPGPSEIRWARNFGGGWQSNTFASFGRQNTQPDVIEYAGVTYVAWNRDGIIWTADNASGPFLSHNFLPAGSKPSVAVSGANVFVSWTAESPTRVVLAQRTNGVWTTVQFAGPSASSMTVLAQASKARLLYRTGSQVVLRPQS
jgi:hypothetical protein